MDKFVIEGGKRLGGTIRVSGAKNAVLPMMAATLLVSGKSEIQRVPNLRDTRTMANLLRIIGAQVGFKDDVIKIDTTHCNHPEAPYDLVKTMRASFYALGPLTARFGRAKVSLPGGCAWGPRPVDLHLKGIEKLGASVELDSGYIYTKAERLKGTTLNLEISSVGATGNLMMAAVLAEGETVIENAAREPEMSCLADFLRKMGAQIEGDGTGTIKITGVDELQPAKMEVIPDRIEAGTYMVTAAATGGAVKVDGIEPAHLGAVTEHLRHAGVELEVEEDSITVDRQSKLKSVDMTTGIYPGFPTDMQAQWLALMSLADGTSTVTETIYKDRFTHVAELIRLGADLKINENVVIVEGKRRLKGAPVMSTDIRASASLIIAGLAAEGRTDLHRIYHIERGYEDIERKLRGIGAEIIREQGPEV